MQQSDSDETPVMKPPYWWCLVHEAVEGRDGCANSDRLGPYESVDDAERALQTARERTAAWDNDPRWGDGPASP